MFAAKVEVYVGTATVRKVDRVGEYVGVCR